MKNDSKKRIQQAINHQESDIIPVDFGATSVTGIHCKIIGELRRHYGLEDKPVKITDTFQMLGEVDEELADIIGIDCLGVGGSRDIFNLDTTAMHEQVTPWGQKVLVPTTMNLTPNEDGNIYVHAGGDSDYPASARIPDGGYFFDAIERQKEIVEDKLDPQDNLEEFCLISDAEIEYYKQNVAEMEKRGKAIVASFGGTALGDVAFVPGMGLKNPKGIRSVVEWYMSTAIRQDYIHEIFDREIDIAIENYKKLWAALGDKIDVVLTCGTDFGTQDSQFCSVETFKELWYPHYKKMNDWIHSNTSWKIFKHSCGSIVPLLPSFIDLGFDIINPVQINAKGMDPRFLKKEFGKDITFWGGGIDTQKVLPFGTCDDVRRHVIEECEILGKDGGFVFNTVHNIQANVPIENVITLFDTLREIRK